MTAVAVSDVTDATFAAEVLGSYVPVLVDDLRVHGLARQLKQGQAEGAFGEFTPGVMAMSIAQAVDGVAAAYAADPTLDLEKYGREVADTFVKATAP